MLQLLFYFTFFVSLMVLTPLHAGQVTLSTYYPAPSGNYTRLKGTGFMLKPTQQTAVQDMYKCDFTPTCSGYGSTSPYYNTPAAGQCFCPMGLMYFDDGSTGTQSSGLYYSDGSTGWQPLSGVAKSGVWDLGNYSQNGTFVSGTTTPLAAAPPKCVNCDTAWTSAANPGGATSLGTYSAPTVPINVKWNDTHSLSNANFTVSDTGSPPSCNSCGSSGCGTTPPNCVDTAYPYTDGNTWRVGLDGSASNPSNDSFAPTSGSPTPSDPLEGSNVLVVNLENLPRGTVLLNYSWNIDMDEYINEIFDEILKTTQNNSTGSKVYYNPFYLDASLCTGNPGSLPPNTGQTCLTEWFIGAVSPPSSPNIDVVLQKWSWSYGWDPYTSTTDWHWMWVNIDHTGAMTDVGNLGNNTYTGLQESSFPPGDQWVSPFSVPGVAVGFGGVVGTFGNTTANRIYDWAIGSQAKSYNHARYFFRIIVVRRGVVGTMSATTSDFPGVKFYYDVPLALRINNFRLDVSYQQ